MINPDYIRTFLTLAETKHFTRTAERLHMTQPGVSQHLKRLESYYGTALIQRQGKSFTVTDAGRRLVTYGQKLFDEHRRFHEGIGEDKPNAGSCRVSAPGSFAFKIFDTLLGLAKAHRDLRVEVMVAPTRSVLGYLKEERVDVGFLSEVPKDQLVDCVPFSQERLLLVAPKGQKVKGYESLVGLGYVNHPDGFSFAERLFEKNFPDEFAGMDGFPVTVFINQINRILDPVAEGLGFAILPETAVLRYHRKQEVQVVKLEKEVEDPVFMITRKGEKLPLRYDEFLRRLKR
jgi:LysR family transcriptional regulator, transcriptional activator of the cysJI operon